MTAPQGWLNFSLDISPVDHLKGIIRDAWRALASDDAVSGEEPQLMGRGLERC